MTLEEWIEEMEEPRKTQAILYLLHWRGIQRSNLANYTVNYDQHMIDGLASWDRYHMEDML